MSGLTVGGACSTPRGPGRVIRIDRPTSRWNVAYVVVELAGGQRACFRGGEIRAAETQPETLQ